MAKVPAPGLVKIASSGSRESGPPAKAGYNARVLFKKLKAIYRLNRQRLLRRWSAVWLRISTIPMPIWEKAGEEGKERKSWHLQPSSIVLLYLSAAVLWFWGHHEPFIPPGYGVTALAVAAAAMTVLGEMKGKEKLAWILVLFGFLFLELHAIKVERASQEELQRVAREEQLRHFGEISKGIQKSIEQSDRDFEETMNKSNQVIGLQSTAVAGLTANLNTLTGADSFCYLQFAPGQSFLPFVHIGKFPLYGVSARIVELDQNGRIKQGNNLMGVTVLVGDMIKGHANIIQAAPSGLGSSPDYFNANVEFTARNGDWVELLRIQRVNGKLVQALRVVGRFTSLKKEKPLCETIDREFPRKPNGDIDSDFHSTGLELPQCQ